MGEKVGEREAAVVLAENAKMEEKIASRHCLSCFGTDGG